MSTERLKCADWPINSDNDPTELGLGTARKPIGMWNSLQQGVAAKIS